MDDPFLDDGCTGVSDGTWRHCCDIHDPQFLTGQTVTDFMAANQELFQCVAESDPSNPFILLVAVVMFLGVSSPVGWWFFRRGKTRGGSGGGAGDAVADRNGGTKKTRSL